MRFFPSKIMDTIQSIQHPGNLTKWFATLSGFGSIIAGFTELVLKNETIGEGLMASVGLDIAVGAGLALHQKRSDAGFFATLGAMTTLLGGKVGFVLIFDLLTSSGKTILASSSKELGFAFIGMAAGAVGALVYISATTPQPSSQVPEGDPNENTFLNPGEGDGYNAMQPVV